MPFPIMRQRAQSPTRHRNSPERRSRHSVSDVANPQVGVMLMMAMSAATFQDTSTGLVRQSTSLGQGQSAPRFAHTPYTMHSAAMAFAASEALNAAEEEGELSMQQAAPDTAGHEGFEGDGSFEDDFDARTADSYEEDAMEIEGDDVVMPVALATSGALAPRGPRQSLSDLPTTVVANALQFLTLTELGITRNATVPLARAAAMLAPQPFGTPTCSFVRCDWFGSLPNPRPRPHAPPTPFVWRCMNCSGYSSYHEACTVCGVNVRQGAIRVFVGQLRKRHSALALQHVLRLYAPNVRVMHIESHSNQEGFEKGAAWLYLETPEDAAVVLQLNKRVFFDADACDAEGFWFIEGRTDEELEINKRRLFDFAETRKVDETRRRLCLPGQPLVVEAPAKSMLSGSSSAPLQTVTKSLIPDQNGWYRRRQ